MQTAAIIQARAGSTRLPGKVLADLAGAPMLARQIERVRRARRVDEVIVATSDLARDDAVVDAARAAGARWFRGSERDVLARFAGAAREARADLVVRLTADCPLVDPEVIDRVVAAVADDPEGADYASTDLPRPTFPRGLDAEALFADVLFRADRLARSAPAREHVTYFVWAEEPALFRLRGVTAARDDSDLRLTVDTPSDLTLVRALFEELGLAERTLPYDRVVEHLRSRPALVSLNAHVVQRDPRAAEAP